MSVAQVSHAAINFSKKEMPFRILNAFRYTLGFIPFKVTCNLFMHCSKLGCAHVRRHTATPSISLPFLFFYCPSYNSQRGLKKLHTYSSRRKENKTCKASNPERKGVFRKKKNNLKCEYGHFSNLKSLVF